LLGEPRELDDPGVSASPPAARALAALSVLVKVGVPLATILSVGVAAYYASLTHRLADVAERQLAFMMAQNGAEMRPFLAIDGQSNLSVQSDPSGTRIGEATTFAGFTFTVVNCGRVPIRFRVVDESFNGIHPAFDVTSMVLFPGRTSDTHFEVQFPQMPVASLNGAAGSLRYTYERLGGGSDAHSYFYDRAFTVDLHTNPPRLNFTKENAD
jgi:hypothetical protein